MYIANDFFVKLLFLSEHEFDAYGQLINVVAHFFGEPVETEQPGVVFLGGDDHLGLGHGGKALVELSDVALGELMMVGKAHGLDVAHVGFEVENHLLGRGDAGEQQHIGALRDFLEREVVAAEEGFERAVVQRGEEELLIRVEVKGLGEHSVFHGLEVTGALGDDNNIGARLAALGLAKPSGRQQLVVDDETVVVDEQDVDAGLYIAVLVGVVEQDDVGVLSTHVGSNALDAVAALAVDDHMDVGKLLHHLIGLVANVAGGALLVGKHVAPALALVATTEHGYLHLVAQQTDEVLHMGRLAGASHRDVADGDDGDVVALALQDTELEHLVPESHPEAVEPAEGCEPFVDFDEVAFHY